MKTTSAVKREIRVLKQTHCLVINNMVESKDSMSSEACNVCGLKAMAGGGRTGLLRCTQCKSAWYCSRDCQKKDWKQHKKACKASTNEHQKAFAAWNELQEILKSTRADEAAAAFHRASDEIAALQAKAKTQESQAQEIGKPAKRSFSLKTKSADVECSGMVDQTQSKKKGDSEPKARGTEERTNQTATPLTPSKSKSKLVNGLPSAIKQERQTEAGPLTKKDMMETSAQLKYDKYFDFYIEEFPHLMCYQLDLRLKSNNDTDSIDLQHWSLLVSNENEEESTVSLYNSFLQHKLLFCIPGRVSNQVESVAVQHGRLSIRLSLESPGCDFLETVVTPAEMANQVACVGCGTPLTRDPISTKQSSKIDRVLTLPSGCWDDMADYLVCFDGQPSFDFSSLSTEARQGIVLEDASVMVYHLQDIVPNVQILAIPGFGEDERQSTDVSSSTLPLMRGSRSWGDTVGGATVACSCCCLVLGVAPVELADTVRLFKHRVTPTSQGEKSMISLLNFVVHSMIRYAESKAMFSFLVRNESNPHKALILQLVGSDRKAARAFKNDTTGGLAWSKLAKVLYEERDDVPTADLEANITWTKGDWCCPPEGTIASLIREEKKSDGLTNLPQSYISMCLGASDWTDLKRQLEAGSDVFPESVASAAFFAKNGRTLATNGNGFGLSAVFLD